MAHFDTHHRIHSSSRAARRRKGQHMAREASGRRGGPRGRGRGRGRQVDPPITSIEELRAWFAGNLPDDWFTKPVAIVFDRDEILVTGDLAPPTVEQHDDAPLANQARIQAFRENTRDERIGIASRAEATFLRKVSWAVTCGDEAAAYTVANVPVMTRLPLEDRQLLDTLIDAGVARSRSEALAWTVRLVAENEADWIGKLREAMKDVEALRNQGPSSRS